MPRKSGKNKGGKKGGKVGKDPVTGRSLLLSAEGNTVEIKDDVVYEIWEGSSDTVADDVYTPVNGIPSGAPRPGTHYGQFQFGDRELVISSYGDWYPDVLYRSVLVGDFSYDSKGRLTRASVSSEGMIQKSDENPDVLFGNIDEYPQRWNFTPAQYPGTPPEPTNVAGYSWTSSPNEESGGGLAAIRAFGGGKFFFEGWQNNLFDTSLV
jgi:hypothetical protein